MLRTFNYTKRKKIRKENVHLTLNTLNGDTYFNAVFNVDDLEFSPEARVFIEAYYGPTYYRFDFGQFSERRQPEDTNISELKKISDKVYFRLKIVDSQTGLILGYIDKLNLADEEKKSTASIFYVNAVQMDTHEIWRMNFDADIEGTPVLEINNAVEGIRDIAKSDPRFLALVYPAAIRIILEKIAEANDFDRNDGSWSSKWIIFAEDILGVNLTPENNDSEEKLNEWYDNVVRAFCVRNKLYEQYIKILP